MYKAVRGRINNEWDCPEEHLILSLQKYMIALRKPWQILNLNPSHKVSVSKSFALPWSWVHLFICKWYVRSFQFYRLANRVYRVMIAQLFGDFVKIRSTDTDWKISWNNSYKITNFFMWEFGRGSMFTLVSFWKALFGTGHGTHKSKQVIFICCSQLNVSI